MCYASSMPPFATARIRAPSRTVKQSPVWSTFSLATLGQAQLIRSGQRRLSFVDGGGEEDGGFKDQGSKECVGKDGLRFT